MEEKKSEIGLEPLAKSRTGIKGLDDITGGGLPKARPTLVSGSPGSGKTLIALEFLVRGATLFGEPGVFMAFEETEEELIRNVASLGFDLKKLIKERKLYIDYVYIERSEIEETGEYDLEGLFIRLDQAITTVGAKRIVLDTLEVLFSGFANSGILRAELRRLFRWLKNKGVTAIITGEQGENTLTRHGLEEYVSDCVISLEHVQRNHIYTRRLRIVKYRGTKHETNDFPFLIDDDGISILPITSLSLDHSVSSERISSGITALDEMLGGEGFYRGSSILVSGTAGTGKTSLCGHMADAACRRGEKALYLSFEESSQQIIRNLGSIGIHLEKWEQAGLLRFHSERVSIYGLEAHLTLIHKLINSFQPDVILLDPLNAYLSNDDHLEAKSMIVRLIDYIKSNHITGFFTTLTSGASVEETTDLNISSLMDSWLLIRDIEENGERNRGLFVLKSRGIANSNQIREFLITSQGVELKDVYLSSTGVLTGSARVVQELSDQQEAMKLEERIKRLEIELTRKQKATQVQIELSEIQMKTDEMDIRDRIDELKRQHQAMEIRRQDIYQSRTK
ncbi:MAG TPA: circadian clock protein KaiC [Anaerolineae bacterium]|nr:circadian clock protein KaiC [Anaerolineae bacterium]